MDILSHQIILLFERVLICETFTYKILSFDVCLSTKVCKIDLLLCGDNCHMLVFINKVYCTQTDAPSSSKEYIRLFPL